MTRPVCAFWLVIASLSAPFPLCAQDTHPTSPEAKEPAVDWGTLFQVHYQNRVRAFDEQNQLFENVVLVGDSITEGFDVRVYFPGRRVLNRGIGGDVIGNGLADDDKRGLLRRLDNSIFHCAPRCVFLLIGVNDLNSGRTTEVMETGYREILTQVRKRAPELKLYVQSVLPTRGDHASKNAAIVDFNKRLQRLSAEFSHEFLDLHTLMCDEKGELRVEFTDDGLHLTEPAYRIWQKEVERRMGWNASNPTQP